MTMQAEIEAKIRGALAPSHLEVVNESHKHAVPPGSESHFKLVVVSDSFVGQPLVRRHQAVNRLLADELESGVHALAMDTLTPGEWEKRGHSSPPTPECMGGSKAAQ